MKPRVAVIGSGIAGLACTYLLRDKFDVILFEKNNYPGGHSNTIDIDDDPNTSFDTGFMVFNHITYPLLVKLFRELEVDTYPTSMSFSVQHLAAGLEYCGTGWNGLFGQRRNIAKPSFWKLLADINRFNLESKKFLLHDQHELTVEEFCKEIKLNKNFLDNYLVPMSGAVWSTPAEKMLSFPASTLIRFFDNHGFLGMNTQHQWYTVNGGSRAYVQRLLDISKPAIKLNSKITSVKRLENKILIENHHKGEGTFDHCIIAAHANQAYEMVKDLNSDEKKILSAFSYQKNIATIHRDEQVLPKRKRIWSSWNYRIESSDQSQNSTIYWMNNLQKINSSKNYFVSIDDKGSIERSKTIREIEYEHPLFSMDAIRAQKQLNKLNRDNLFFCGSYHRYGFHEDALMSAVKVCEQLTDSAWK